MGRTGKLFACEHDGLEPDILITAKSIAGGLPLAAVVGRAELMDSPGIGGLGGTYSGNPLSLAAAHAVLDLFERGDLLTRADEIGARAEARARTWAARFPLVGDIRRLGAMVGVELVTDRSTREPAKTETNAVIKAARERGVIMISAGTYGNVIRLLVPLVVSDEQLDEGLNVIEESLNTVSAGAAAGARAAS
jgi:4-aminobutyrate aminotransferase/(S)-3-amino-2-methylpropionate transaminase